MDRYIEFIFNHYILSLSLATVTYLLIQEFFDSAFKRFQSITPLQAVSKMNDDEVVVIDVRDAPEFFSKHIEQAINVPLDQLKQPEQLEKLALHQNKMVLVACQDGIRSNSAGKILGKAGFKQVFIISGGMNAWEDEYRLPIKIGRKK